VINVCVWGGTGKQLNEETQCRLRAVATHADQRRGRDREPTFVH